MFCRIRHTVCRFCKVDYRTASSLLDHLKQTRCRGSNTRKCEEWYKLHVPQPTPSLIWHFQAWDREHRAAVIPSDIRITIISNHLGRPRKCSLQRSILCTHMLQRQMDGCSQQYAKLHANAVHQNLRSILHASPTPMLVDLHVLPQRIALN